MSDAQPPKLAAIVYRPYHDVDTLLATFASDVICHGYRVGGVVQENIKGRCDTCQSMRLIDLMTGRAIAISQELGNGAEGCRLNPAGLAEAAVVVSGAVAANVELVVVNKFGKQEFAGGGLRAGIADAVMAGVPLVTAVPERNLDAWLEFTGSHGITLLCEQNYIDAWWRNVALHEKPARARASAQMRRSGLETRRVSGVADLRTMPAI